MENETTKTVASTQGKCPNCKSEDIDYGVMIPQDEFVFYPFTCNECGVEGKEYYNLEYTETDYYVTD